MPSRSNKILSGRQPRHCMKVLQRLRDWLRPHIQGVANGLVKPKPVLVLSLKNWRISHLDSAVCPRTLHWNRSPRKLEDWYAFWMVKLPFILSKDKRRSVCFTDVHTDICYQHGSCFALQVVFVLPKHNKYTDMMHLDKVYLSTAASTLQ
jgi:hypothetical protein